jgi:hypothetical protein
MPVPVTTFVGRVPIGIPFLEEDNSSGEIIVVMCPKCKQPLIEFCNSYNLCRYVTSSTYPDPETIGVVERGSYGPTERMYCFCGITTEISDPYCCSGQFGICWDPSLDHAAGGGCAVPVTDLTRIPFDYMSFTPKLEWFEVGVLVDDENCIFLSCDNAQCKCLHCGKNGIVSIATD